MRPKAPSHSVSVLLLGLEASGKTALTHQLRNYCQSVAVSGRDLVTVPTAGKNIDAWTHLASSTRVTVTEVGGTFAAQWPKYLRDFAAVIYTVDLSNAPQLGPSCVELFHLLRLPAVAERPVLVLLTKGDMPATFGRAAADQMLMLDLVRTANPRLSIRVDEVCAFSGAGLDRVMDWILTHKTKAAK